MCYRPSLAANTFFLEVLVSRSANEELQPISICFCLKMEGTECNAGISMKIVRFDLMKRKETFRNSETHSISFRI